MIWNLTHRAFKLRDNYTNWRIYIHLFFGMCSWVCGWCCSVLTVGARLISELQQLWKTGPRGEKEICSNSSSPREAKQKPECLNPAASAWNCTFRFARPSPVTHLKFWPPFWIAALLGTCLFTPCQVAQQNRSKQIKDSLAELLLCFTPLCRDVHRMRRLRGQAFNTVALGIRQTFFSQFSPTGRSVVQMFMAAACELL